AAAMAGGRTAVAVLVLACLRFHRSSSFNLDVDKPSVYEGSERSYFGFSVDFFNSDSVFHHFLVGAPRANTSSSSSVVERGAVFSCPWNDKSCKEVPFDSSGTRTFCSCLMEFKSKQWFGASVRSDGEHILACAPLYQWATFGNSEREPVGTCYLKKGATIVEYSPCRSRQLISDDVSELFTRFNQDYFISYTNTLATKSAGMAAYFGHSVAASDLNNDGLMDVMIGAPLFMDRGSDGNLREVGQVSVYLGKGGFSFRPAQMLTGVEVYARYGSAIAALGDLNRDGYNDVAISAPYGGTDRYGLVYIHNGRSEGPNPSPSQVLQGKWASSYMPASFGYSMTGNTDIDQNGYPDLIVGVFGADKAILYRARPVISVNATLDITPQILNPKEKACTHPVTNTPVSCFKVKYCLKASGYRAPDTIHLDLLLDRLKQKEATKRVRFLHSQAFQYSKNMTVSSNKVPSCEELEVFLRDEQEFRDKITPISVAMEYNLDYQPAVDQSKLLPILDASTPNNVTKQAHILLDCGDDNICKPNLTLSVKSDREEIYIGDDNTLTLEIVAENHGEGAYEAELHVFPPQQADFIEVVRSQTLSRLSCAYKKENQTKIVVCDLGNPMKAGTKILAELRFSVHQLSEEDTKVKFDLQIVSSNQFNNTSAKVTSTINLAVLAKVSIRGSSSPSQVLLPIANWKSKEPPLIGDDIGPAIIHVYELVNHGPSTFSKASLKVEWPYHYRNGSLLYITSFETQGPINCTTDMMINPLNVSTEGRSPNRVKRDLESKDAENNLQTLDCTTAECLQLKCQVGRLEKTKNAILFIYSRLDVKNFLRPENQNRSYVVQTTASFSVFEMPYKHLSTELPSNSTTVRQTHTLSVTWVADTPQPVPAWVVALAVLAGLLLLALLIFIMYKVSPLKLSGSGRLLLLNSHRTFPLNFFLLSWDSLRECAPPQEDCTEKEQLQPEENGNTEA
uniref:Integrin, alpha V n=1 Tax=Oryzias sinensis TaxID=183150 RepID=A0A8C7YA35_9TELE